MNHDIDNLYLAGDPIEIDSDNVWNKPKQQGKTFHQSMLNELIKMEDKAMRTVPVSGKLMHDGEIVGTITDISIGFDDLRVPRKRTIFCTHNSYNINRKTLIL